jgi:3-keto-5-aminohexanoate cleavage enzyme
VASTEPLIINLAPTGMVPTKEMTPHVPISCEEILDDVARCRQLGAAIVHVHAREADGTPSHRAERFAPIVAGIRRIDPELIVCVSCSGRQVSELEKRAEVLELDGDAKPDMGSLTLGSNNFAKEASVNPPDVILGLAARMQERGIAPELEVFEPGMLSFAAHLAHRGKLTERCYVNILLGNLGTSPLSPGLLGAFLALLPEGWTWAAAGLGRYQLDANLVAVALDGNVRTGLEDNIWWDRERTRLATNPELVGRVARAAELAERPVASPRQARERLGLPLQAAITG